MAVATCVSVLHLKSIIALIVLLRVFAEADGILIIVHGGLSDKIPQRKPPPRFVGSWYVLLPVTSGSGSWIREGTGMEGTVGQERGYSIQRTMQSRSAL